MQKTATTIKERIGKRLEYANKRTIDLYKLISVEDD